MNRLMVVAASALSVANTADRGVDAGVDQRLVNAKLVYPPLASL